jgi:hypothetical protein
MSDEKRRIELCLADHKNLCMRLCHITTLHKTNLKKNLNKLLNKLKIEVLKHSKLLPKSLESSKKFKKVPEGSRRF